MLQNMFKINEIADLAMCTVNQYFHFLFRWLAYSQPIPFKICYFKKDLSTQKQWILPL